MKKDIYKEKYNQFIEKPKINYKLVMIELNALIENKKWKESKDLIQNFSITLEDYHDSINTNYSLEVLSLFKQKEINSFIKNQENKHYLFVTQMKYSPILMFLFSCLLFGALANFQEYDSLSKTILFTVMPSIITSSFSIGIIWDSKLNDRKYRKHKAQINNNIKLL